PRRAVAALGRCARHARADPCADPARAPGLTMAPHIKKLAIVLVALAAIIAAYAWRAPGQSDTPAGFVSGNGRIEATEIDIATRLGGRVDEILVGEGDFVKAGQLLARMRVDSLDAQRNEAVAMRQQAIQGVAAAQAQVALR